MPMILRVVMLAGCVAIGSVLVRHLTETLQGRPLSHEAAASGIAQR